MINQKDKLIDTIDPIQWWAIDNSPIPESIFNTFTIFTSTLKNFEFNEKGEVVAKNATTSKE